MLHNTGPYGPNEVPVNHPNAVNMSPLSGHINMPHNINNVSKSGQQSVQTASGHYNLPEYTGYSHVPLNMSPQIGNIPTYPQVRMQHHYMPQHSAPAADMNWQNGMLPMNLNVQHEHNMNIMNYPNNYEKRPLDTVHDKSLVHDDFKEPPVRKVPLNIPQIPVKTTQKHISPENYMYNDNFKYSNHNLDLSMKPQEKIQIDSTRRKNIENTVRLIENILINSSKNKDEGNSFVNNVKTQSTTESSSIYNTRVGSMPQNTIYGSKDVSTSETPNVYSTKVGSTSESNILTSKIESMHQTSIYGNKHIDTSETPNIYNNKMGSPSDSNLTTKIGALPQTSIIYGSKPISTSETPNIYSNTIGSTDSNNLIAKTSTIYGSMPIPTSETPNFKKPAPDCNIFNTNIGSTTSNIYSKVMPTSEATNVFTKTTSVINLYNDKKAIPTTNTTNSVTDTVNIKTVIKTPNVMTESNKADKKMEYDDEDESSDEESSSEDEKPSVEERDLKEIVIESKIEIKVEKTNCVDMDYLQPFLRDCNGVQRDEVDSKIIDGETSVDEASAAIRNETNFDVHYECPHCTLLFNNPKRFLIHTKWHTFGLTYEKRMEVVREREERKQANREAKVLERMKAKEVTDGVSTVGEVFPCKDCDKVFSAKGSLKNHRKRTHPTRSRDCKICRKTIVGWTAMRAHVATHSCGNSGGYQCMECPKRFKYSHSLAKHKDTHLEKTHGCSECPKMFGSQALLKMHMKTHERAQRGTTFRCTYCGKGFYECYSLQVHERTHRNERPFSCEICNTSFGTNSSLKRHIKVSHSTSKPHECSICHRSFSTERIRDRHEVRVHSQPEDFKFPCKQCSCKYLKLKDLQKHVYKVHPKNKRRKKAQSDSE